MKSVPSFLPSTPKLKNGDRLTRSEFERRYLAMTDVNKAELIEGIVYMPSPVRVKGHGEPHGHIITWLGVYCAATPGVQLADNATVRLDRDNEPQPDALLRLAPENGGRSRITEDDYIEGPPELIVEIASSSSTYDLHDKREIYLRNGVQEYIVWQVLNQKLSWFRLQQDNYILLPPDAENIIYSETFPGLNLSVSALLAGDLATVLTVLQQGIISQSHQAFVKSLLKT